MRNFLAQKFLFWFILIAVLLLLFSSRSVYATSKVFKDDFDDGNADGWIVPRNTCFFNGSPSQWQVINGKVGTKINGGGCITELVPNDILWNNIGDNYSFEFDMDLVSGTDHNFGFRNTDPTKLYYGIHTSAPNSMILQLVGNSNIYQNTVYLPGEFSNGQTIHFKIDVIGEHIKIYKGIPPQLILDYPDAGGLAPTGKIVLQASAGSDPSSETYFDNIVVTSINPDLNIPSLKQTSEPWQGLTYDTANIWTSANSTINLWGCALTSVTMVLQYYGITKLVDGTVLNPGTLNSWLKSQTDGYIGNGLLNWLAISRLSKLAKVQNSSFLYDALEFRRISGSDSAQLTYDINNLTPDILEEPGHFVVAKGMNGNTFNINDPYYDRLTLNEGYNNSYLSIEKYIPSHTNLSYILLAIDPSMDLLIIDPQNNKTGSDGITNYTQISNSSYYLQTGITAPITGITSTSKKILLLPTPVDGNYSIVIYTNNSSVQNTTFNLYEYNKSGYLSTATFSAALKQNFPAQYEFIFSQDLDQQSAPIDNTKPKIISAKTADTDKNGRLDEIIITFSKDLLGSTVTNSDFSVTTYTLKQNQDASENNGVVTLYLVEKTENDTGQTPKISLANHGVEDFSNGNWNTEQTITTQDFASPLVPIINIAQGDYYAPQLLTISSSDLPNIPSLYYTFDGSDPASSSSRLLYSTPLTISDDLIFKAVAIDTGGNISDTRIQTYGIAPVIDPDSITVTVSDTVALVSWTTNKNSYSRVIFGKQPKNILTFTTSGGTYGYENTTIEDNTRVQNHTVTLPNLEPGSTYYYRVISRASPEQISTERNFTIPVTPIESVISSTSHSPASPQLSSSISSSNFSKNMDSSQPCNDQKPQNSPVLLSAFPGINTVTLTWTESSTPVSYYLVSYGIHSGETIYGNPNIGGRGTTSYVVENLSGGKRYYFKIRAGNGCMPGEYSNEITATPLGFELTGIGRGFTKDVLGTSTNEITKLKQHPISSFIMNTNTQSAKSNLLVLNNLETTLKIVFITLGLTLVGWGGINIWRFYIEKDQV